MAQSSPWLSRKGLTDIVLANGIAGIPYVYHTWFILPYFILSISSNKLFAWLRTPRMAIVYSIVVLMLFVGLDCADKYMNVQTLPSTIIWAFTTCKHVLCYSLFYVAGYWGYRKIHRTTLLKMAVGFLLMYLLSRHFYSHDLQANKFPPNLNFILYNAFTLTLLSWLCSYIKFSFPRWLQRWNTHGYSIYLYQNFFHILMTFVLARLSYVVDMPETLRFLFMVVFLFACGSGLGWCCRYKWVSRLLS